MKIFDFLRLCAKAMIASRGMLKRKFDAMDVTLEVIELSINCQKSYLTYK
jgi:hypothetical protein